MDISRTLVNQRTKLKSLIYVASLYFFSDAVAAQTQIPEACQKLKVAFAEDWFPIAFIDAESDNKVRGVAISLLEQLANEHKVVLEILNPVPWKRAIHWMDQDKTDILAGHYWTRERSERWLISQPIYTNDIRFFYLADSDLNANSLDQLAEFLGAYPAGASYGSEVDKVLKSDLNAQSFKDNQSIISALLKGRVDYFLMAKEDGLAHINKLDLKAKVQMSSFSLAQLTVHFSFSKQSSCKELFKSFNLSLDKYMSAEHMASMVKEAGFHYFKSNE